MKKLLALFLFLSSVVRAQTTEIGINYGFGINVTASLRLPHHFKIGVGYEYTALQPRSISTDVDRIQLHLPFLYAEYFKPVRKHEFYYGIDAGRANTTQYYHYSGYGEVVGYEIGLHAGYSRKLIRGLYGNAQAGLLYCPVISSKTVFIPITIGLHYMFGK